MEIKKKNKVFGFLCAFLPGAAEMYYGMMKSGISIMGIFFLSIFIPNALHTSDVFIIFPMFVWFFGFFHARNVAAIDDAKFAEIKDCYIWEELDGDSKFAIKDNSRKIIAILLIIVGISLAYKVAVDAICRFIPDSAWNMIAPVFSWIPQGILAVAIIVAGVKMISGKKKELIEDGKNN